MDPYSVHGGGDSSTMALITSRYIRHSKSVSILWGVFTVCSAILNIVVFLQEEWVGDTPESKSPGHFGLWRFCTVLSSTAQLSGDGSVFYEPKVRCVGSLDNFASILSPAFRASTVFIGLAVLVSILAVVAFLLFCFVKSHSVFEICGTMQFLEGICLGIGILCFPAGWDNDHVRGICGKEADDFKLGNCGLRWAFVLSIIALVDAFVLGCLAFTLSNRNAKPQPMMNHENPYMNPSIYKGEFNNGFVGDTHSLAGSRKSLTLPPVVMLPHPSAMGGQGPMPGGPGTPGGTLPPPPEAYSDFGQRSPGHQQGGGHNRSNIPSPYRNPYATSIQNFQL